MEWIKKHLNEDVFGETDANEEKRFAVLVAIVPMAALTVLTNLQSLF